MREERSDVRFVRSSSDVKQWLRAGPPSVEAARPARCPCCGAASRPAGKQLTLHGHGLRSRTLFSRIGQRTRPVEIQARRYVCLACDAVLLVVPADLAYRRLYTRVVIAAALAMWSHERVAAGQVRNQLGAFALIGDAASGWPSLLRWSSGWQRLWPRIAPLCTGSPRTIAHAISVKLSAFAPVPTGHVPHDACTGALHAA